MTGTEDCCTPPGPGGAFDLAILGAGSAGFSAAITAAETGARVALIGYGTIGGTCVNVGCVPSKTLIRAAETLHQSREANRFCGIDSHAELNDWRALRTQKDTLVNDLRQAKYVSLLAAYPQITYLEGRGRFEAEGVRVGDGLIRAGRYLIATGTSPASADIEGIDRVDVLTSTSALDLESLPGSLLVIGGGYIGCELAQMFSRLGSQVTLVTRSRLLSAGEPEISRALTRYLTEEGMTVLDSLAYERIESTPQGVALTVLRDGRSQRLSAERVLLATGRRPNVEDLGLETAGIRLNRSGGIDVDECMRTSNPSIYAAGDVTGEDQFVYMAAYGAKLAVKNALHDEQRRYDNRAMPAIVFTDPQVASVGLTEARAVRLGLPVKTSLMDLDQVPRALAARDTRGLIKLVAHDETGELLGAHILAPEGADSIQTAALAIAQRMTHVELADMIFPYLTTVEGLKLAALGFDRDVRTLSCCAG